VFNLGISSRIKPDTTPLKANSSTKPKNSHKKTNRHEEAKAPREKNRLPQRHAMVASGRWALLLPECCILVHLFVCGFCLGSACLGLIGLVNFHDLVWPQLSLFSPNTWLDTHKSEIKIRTSENQA